MCMHQNCRILEQDTVKYHRMKNSDQVKVRKRKEMEAEVKEGM